MPVRDDRARGRGRDQHRARTLFACARLLAGERAQTARPADTTVGTRLQCHSRAASTTAGPAGPPLVDVTPLACSKSLPAFLAVLRGVIAMLVQRRCWQGAALAGAVVALAALVLNEPAQRAALLAPRVWHVPAPAMLPGRLQQILRSVTKLDGTLREFKTRTDGWESSMRRSIKHAQQTIRDMTRQSEHAARVKRLVRKTLGEPGPPGVRGPRGYRGPFGDSGGVGDQGKRCVPLAVVCVCVCVCVYLCVRARACVCVCVDLCVNSERKNVRWDTGVRWGRRETQV